MEFERKKVKFTSLVLGNDVDFKNGRQKSGLNASSIKELAESIKAHGLLEDLIVWVPKDGDHAGKNVVISGERRYRALSLLVKEKAFDADNIPVKVSSLAPVDARVTALIANVQREDLSGLEIAQELQMLIDVAAAAGEKLKQTEIAKLVKKSNTWVSLHLGALKKLTPEAQVAWKDGKITDPQAFDLAKVENPKKQNEALKEVVDTRANAKRGDKSKADQAAKKAAGKDDKPVKTSAREMTVMYEDVLHASEKVGEDFPDYARGVLDGLRFYMGEIACLEFDEDLLDHVKFGAAKATKEAVSGKTGNSANLFDDDADEGIDELNEALEAEANGETEEAGEDV